MTKPKDILPGLALYHDLPGDNHHSHIVEARGKGSHGQYAVEVATGDLSLSRRVVGVKRMHGPSGHSDYNDFVVLCQCDGTMRSVAACLGSYNAASLQNFGDSSGVCIDDHDYTKTFLKVQKSCAMLGEKKLNSILHPD